MSMQAGALSTGYYSISYPPSDPRFAYPYEVQEKGLVDANL
jgi:hypothetical protein